MVKEGQKIIDHYALGITSNRWDYVRKLRKKRTCGIAYRNQYGDYIKKRKEITAANNNTGNISTDRKTTETGRKKKTTA